MTRENPNTEISNPKRYPNLNVLNSKPYTSHVSVAGFFGSWFLTIGICLMLGTCSLGFMRLLLMGKLWSAIPHCEIAILRGIIPETRH